MYSNLSKQLKSIASAVTQPFKHQPHKMVKQFVGNLSTNCLSVFDHFVVLTPKGLTLFTF